MTGVRRTLLLVDDDEAVRMTLSALFDDEGWNVIEAASLDEARAALRAPHAAQVVVLDARLPDGSGESLVPEIRAALPDAAIVLVSGELPRIETRVDRVLTKAGDPMVLLEAIEAVVRNATARSRTTRT